MPSDLDLVDFASLTPAAVEAAARRAMERADAATRRIAAIPPANRTYANTLLALEDAADGIVSTSGTHAFMAFVSADDALRDSARHWDQELDKYMVGLAFNEDLYRSLKEFAETPEAQTLQGEDARFLERELRDFRRNGFDLPADVRAALRAKFDRLVELGTTFRQAIDDWDDGIIVDREALRGLPEAWVANLKTVDVDGATKYRVSLDYPEYFPFMSNCPDPELRRELFLKEQTKAGPANIARLEEAIRVRTEIAQLLGYDSWASYVIETRMAKTREAVVRFLDDLRTKVARKAERDLAAMSELKRRETGDGTVHPWDWRYYHNLQLRTQFAVDEFEIAQYFPLDACLEGLFAITQSMMGVTYREVPGAPRWHPDVRTYDIYDADSESDTPIARFHMDLFPRPNKYGHAAAFTMRRGRELDDTTYQRPVSAIVANFTKPGADRPSLLRHQEVITLFHEFGHILHQTLTKARRARFAGTATERDFVEAPSQMLEHWCWEPEVLGSFSRHYETGEPLPTRLLEAMVAARNLNSGITTLRQILFASLDMAYHSPGFDGDTTATLARLHDISGFPYTPGTHFQSGFGHLFGYDAGYYGYLWSHVFGDDMYTLFEQRGPLNREVGAHYRRTILERGGSVDGDELVRSFLGREPNNEAFLRNLGLDPD